MKSLGLCLCKFGLAFTALSSACLAAPILVNGSFEPSSPLTPPLGTASPIPNWTYTGPGTAGSWAAAVLYSGSTPIAYLNPKDGTAVGYIENGGAISQVFNAVAGTVYSFSVWVGKRYNAGIIPTTYQIGFFDPSSPNTWLAVVGGDSASAPAGGWIQSPTVTYLATVSGPIGVRIWNTGVVQGTTTQVLVDAATMTAAGVPEPMTATLIAGGLAGLALLRLRLRG